MTRFAAMNEVLSVPTLDDLLGVFDSGQDVAARLGAAKTLVLALKGRRDLAGAIDRVRRISQV